MSPTRLRNAWLDRAGLIASTTCAIHCAISALLPSLLIAMGLSSLMGHTAEWTLTLIAVGLAGAALLTGLGRGMSRPLWLLLGGALGLLAARFLEEAGLHEVGLGLSLVAGLALAVGHLTRLRRPSLKLPS